jgi:hypothetical protein
MAASGIQQFALRENGVWCLPFDGAIHGVYFLPRHSRGPG